MGKTCGLESVGFCKPTSENIWMTHFCLYANIVAFTSNNVAISKSLLVVLT